MKTALVVATNRADRLADFLAAWAPAAWDALVVVEDGGPKTERVAALVRGARPEALHLGWGDLDALPAADADAFSRRDSGIKAFGFLAAVRDLGADAVLTLDDDCLPDPESGGAAGLVAGHREALADDALWAPSIPGFPTRGLPYGDLGPGRAPAPILHMGLWADVPDYDAPQSLARLRDGGGDPGRLRGYRPPVGRWLAHPTRYWPLCGMHLSFRREALPLMYFPRMGDGVPYRRMDDIWCGAMLQRAARHLGSVLSIGAPSIQHIRASDIMVNLEKEAPGIRANERFWRVVEGAPLGPGEDTPSACMAAFGRHFLATGEGASGDDPKFGRYLTDLGRRVAAWCGMVRNIVT